MQSDHLIDRFVSLVAGEPFRLFQWGTFYKSGKAHDVDPSIDWKLPHFKPSIKLGSHDDETAAGGWIVGLEKRVDGLYAIPEWNEAGAAAMKDGAYRYNSPEILFAGMGYEDPLTGIILEGPMIVGDALLHEPHLGEQTAFFSATPNQTHKEQNMTIQSPDSVSVPRSLLEILVAKLGINPQPAAPDPKAEPDKLEAAKLEAEKLALQAERDAFKAKLEARDAEDTRRAAVTALVTKLQDKEKFGSMYIELAKAEEAAGMMAGMTPDQQAWCMRNFAAHAAEIKLDGAIREIGSEGSGEQNTEDPRLAFDAAVQAIAADKAITYAAAYEIAKKQHADLFRAMSAAPKPAIKKES